MVVTPLPVAAAAAPAPVAGPAAAAAAPPVVTGMLQPLLMEMGAPRPVAQATPAAGQPAPAQPAATASATPAPATSAPATLTPATLTPPAPASAVKSAPVRTPVRERREPAQKVEDTPPAPQPMNFMSIVPISVPLPPPPPPPPASAPSDPPDRSNTAVPGAGSDSTAPVAAEHMPSPSPTPEPAIVVVVRNAEVVTAPEIKPVIAEEKEPAPLYHEEIAATPEPALVAVARPAEKIEAPKPVTMPEPVQVEKPPVRAVALEFRPDGTHDVRVRLEEHGGEVHVSVHSGDPVVTQNLRDGVTSLAATLAQAGYDARTWTPDRGQGQQQQPREERAAKRDQRAADTNFEGALEEISE